MEELVRKFAKKVNSDYVYFRFEDTTCKKWLLEGQRFSEKWFDSYESMVSYMEDEIKSDYDNMVVGKFYLVTWGNSGNKVYPATKLEGGRVKYLTTDTWGSSTIQSNVATIIDTIRVIKEL